MSSSQPTAPKMLGVLVFIAILIGWTFVTDLLQSATASFGEPVAIPGTLSALVFVVAAIAGVYSFIQYSN